MTPEIPFDLNRWAENYDPTPDAKNRTIVKDLQTISKAGLDHFVPGGVLVDVFPFFLEGENGQKVHLNLIVNDPATSLVYLVRLAANSRHAWRKVKDIEGGKSTEAFRYDRCFKFSTRNNAIVAIRSYYEGKSDENPILSTWMMLKLADITADAMIDADSLETFNPSAPTESDIDKMREAAYGDW